MDIKNLEQRAGIMAEMKPLATDAGVLEGRLLRALTGAGACDASAGATVRALMHASRIGVDSHGARLISHYSEMLKGGRLNGRPALTVERRSPAVAMVDGDNGLGHYAAYRAMKEAIALARVAGVGAVGVTRSSHFGAAGAYARVAADAGMFGFATTNSDSVVALFGGAAPFHGTNPLAFAAPSGGSRPWLIDMATSSIPLNRILLYGSLGTVLPEGVAADASGAPTRDAGEVAMLWPMGGADFGFKGAALAGLATVLSAVLTGMKLDHEMIAMVGSGDQKTPRHMGHFLLALNPAHFAGDDAFLRSMTTYLEALRTSPSRGEMTPQAPGDREWQVERDRDRDGIPLDPDTAAFLGLA